MNDHKERAAFTISKSLKAELEDVVPASKRSRFVEKAIADALRAMRASVRWMPWTICRRTAKGEDSVEILRRIRQERDASVVARHEDRPR